jgi:hypothetical protein
MRSAVDQLFELAARSFPQLLTVHLDEQRLVTGTVEICVHGLDEVHAYCSS